MHDVDLYHSPVSHGTTIDLSRPDIQISKSPVLKKTVATANHTSTLQPTLESNNVVEETIIADPAQSFELTEVPPEVVAAGSQLDRVLRCSHYQGA